MRNEKVEDFIDLFISGTYGKKKRLGNYRIFDSDPVSGEEFNCSILVHENSARNKYSQRIIAMNFGDGFSLINSSIDYTYLSDKSGNTSYFCNLDELHAKRDVIESAIVDTSGPEAIINVDGLDLLLFTMSKTIEKQDVWHRTSYPEGRRFVLGLSERHSTVEEAKRSLFSSDLPWVTPHCVAYGPTDDFVDTFFGKHPEAKEKLSNLKHDIVLTEQEKETQDKMVKDYERKHKSYSSEAFVRWLQLVSLSNPFFSAHNLKGVKEEMGIDSGAEVIEAYSPPNDVLTPHITPKRAGTGYVTFKLDGEHRKYKFCSINYQDIEFS